MHQILRGPGPLNERYKQMLVQEASSSVPSQAGYYTRFTDSRESMSVQPSSSPPEADQADFNLQILPSLREPGSTGVIPVKLFTAAATDCASYLCQHWVDGNLPLGTTHARGFGAHECAPKPLA